MLVYDKEKKLCRNLTRGNILDIGMSCVDQWLRFTSTKGSLMKSDKKYIQTCRPKANLKDSKLIENSITFPSFENLEKFCHPYTKNQKSPNPQSWTFWSIVFIADYFLSQQYNHIIFYSPLAATSTIIVCCLLQCKRKLLPFASAEKPKERELVKDLECSTSSWETRFTTFTLKYLSWSWVCDF